MSQFSKPTLQKLNSHLAKLKEAKSCYKLNYKNSKEKNFNHIKILKRNKTLISYLLLELIFINMEILKFNKEKVSLLNNILHKNKKLLINRKFYHDSYLSDEITNFSELNYKNKNLYLQIKELKTKAKEKWKNLKLKLNNSKNNRKLLFCMKLISRTLQKFKNYESLIKNELGKWYIYVARFLVITLLHFIPFIQLSSTLFFNQPNKQITHPITSYLLNFIPFLVPTINITMPVLNQDTISFLLLVPYLYFFIYSFRRYNISRKIAYQGSFALALMLFRYSLILSQEAITVLYKFTKRFFFLRKFQSVELLRDDLNFYVEDLEELRNYREEFLQLGESIFSLDDLTRITKLWESTTIFSLVGVIALLYNYMYFIFRGQKPIIPVVTRTVQRMMIDRNGKES